MSSEDLEKLVGDLEQSHSRLKCQRIQAQGDHNAILSYYETTQSHLSDLELKLCEVDRKIEQARDHHATELQVYEDKLKRLAYDHRSKSQLAEEERKSLLDAEASEQRERKSELHQAKLDHSRAMEEMQVLYAEEIDSARRQNREEVCKELTRTGALLEDLLKHCEDEHGKMKRGMKLERCLLLRATKERGNLRLQKSQQQHEERMSETERYFSDITDGSDSVIRSLKDKLSVMKDAANRNEVKAKELSEDNDRLKGPITETMEKVNRLKMQTKDMEKDRSCLNNCKARISSTRRKHNSMKEEMGALQERYEEATKERDKIKKYLEEHNDFK